MKTGDQNLELILLDKGTFQSLKSEELEIVSKHKLLVPDIFLIENLKRTETLNKLCELENTFQIDHWYVLAKENLLGQGITVIPADIKTITDDPVKLREQIKLAKKIAREYDESPQELLKMNIDLSIKNNMDLTISEFKKLYPDINISNDMIKGTKDGMKRRKSLFSIGEADWKGMSQFIINDLNNKPIRKENRHLKENERV